MQAINGHCVQCEHRLAWILVRGKKGRGNHPLRKELCWTHKKPLEREALLKRHRESEAEIAQHERNLIEGEARLPLEEQLSLKLRRFIEANIPELAGKIRVAIR